MGPRTATRSNAAPTHRKIIESRNHITPLMTESCGDNHISSDLMLSIFLFSTFLSFHANNFLKHNVPLDKRIIQRRTHQFSGPQNHAKIIFSFPFEVYHNFSFSTSSFIFSNDVWAIRRPLVEKLTMKKNTSIEAIVKNFSVISMGGFLEIFISPNFEV